MATGGSGLLEGQPIVPGRKLPNPYSNTNVVDYCVRKNRDSNGNGVIDDSEIKWFMPTLSQTMHIYEWRNAFRAPGGTWSLNRGYDPFSTTSRYYWTTGEATQTNAYSADFASVVSGTNIPTAMPSGRAKEQLNPVRCMRNIPKETDQPLLRIDDQNQNRLIMDVTGTHPPGSIDDRKFQGNPNSELSTLPYNTVGRRFGVSRWYASGSGHGGSPTMGSGNNSWCSNYSEPGYPAGTQWVQPSQKELSILFAYSGMIDELLAQAHGPTPGASTYHRFVTGIHRSITIPSGSDMLYVNFATGEVYLDRKQASAYFRCVTYFDTRGGAR